MCRRYRSGCVCVRARMRACARPSRYSWPHSTKPNPFTHSDSLAPPTEVWPPPPPPPPPQEVMLQLFFSNSGYYKRGKRRSSGGEKGGKQSSSAAEEQQWRRRRWPRGAAPGPPLMRCDGTRPCRSPSQCVSWLILWPSSARIQTHQLWCSLVRFIFITFHWSILSANAQHKGP